MKPRTFLRKQRPQKRFPQEFTSTANFRRKAIFHIHTTPITVRARAFRYTLQEEFSFNNTDNSRTINKTAQQTHRERKTKCTL